MSVPLRLDQLEMVVEVHRLVCEPDGERYPPLSTCPCGESVGIHCRDCGAFIFVVPVTGLPGCAHFRGKETL